MNTLAEGKHMDIVTDVHEIERLSELNASRNSEFRTFLKHRLDWDGEKLDCAVHEILSEVTSAIDCTKCAVCCLEMGISVEPEEIDRMARHTGMSSEEFESRNVVMDSDWSEKIMAESPCMFLDKKLCTIYNDRPVVCRDFPHLHKPDFRSRLFSVFNNAGTCLIVFNVLEELKRRTGWRGRKH